MKIEIILLLDMGFTPKEVSDMTGHKMPLVYYYNRNYKVAKAKTLELMRKYKSGLAG